MGLSVGPRRMSRCDLRQLDDYVQMLVQGKLVALVLAFMLALAGSAQAAVIHVTRSDDPATGSCAQSDCSLRQAIAAAAAGDTIQLDAGGYELTQGSSLAITRDVTITGHGRDNTWIEGFQNADAQGRHDRIMKVTGGTLQITGVTFRDGYDEKDETCQSGCSSITATGGAAILNQARTVLTNVGFTGNDAVSVGGAISSSGTLQMTNVDFDANSATFGGGLFVRGGTVDGTRVTFRNHQGITGSGRALLLYSGTVNLSDSTVVDNSAYVGGGIVNRGGNLNLLSVTFNGNYGGALETDNNATTTVKDTILGGQACVAAGRDRQELGRSARAITVDGGYNLDQDGSCGLTLASDLTRVDPKLAPVADNGGGTPTAALLVGSAALDAGGGCPSIDQRATQRPQGLACDIGAFEAVVTYTAPTVANAYSIEPTTNDVTLQATVNTVGEAGALYFDYGTARDALSTRTPGTGLGVISEPTPRDESVQGLQPGTTYYFQAVVINASGEKRSDIGSFTTRSAPPEIYGFPVHTVPHTSAPVPFVVHPQGADTKYVINYDAGDQHQETAAVTVPAAGGAQQFDVPLKDLAPDTSYVISVEASNSKGEAATDDPEQIVTARQIAGLARAELTFNDHVQSEECVNDATIDWGDGDQTQANAGCSESGNGWRLQLATKHTYGHPGTYHIEVFYSDVARSDTFAHIAGDDAPLVEDLDVDEVTDTTADVSFTINPNGADTSYVLSYDRDDGAEHVDLPAVDIGSAAGAQRLKRTLTGLKPGSDYLFDVHATNSLGQGPWDGGPVFFTTARQVTGQAGSAVTLTDTGETSGCPTATVDWGDHTHSDGAVTCGSGGLYTLNATHTYAAAGRYPIAIAYSTGESGNAFAVIAAAPAPSPTATAVASQPTPTPTPAATPTPTPTPVFHQTVIVKPVSGVVKVQLKGTKKFVDLPA